MKFFEIYNFSESVIIDKTPQNFKWLGFIKIFFPSSKIVICQRNPKDIYELNYERLIEDDKGEIDKLLEFCNLDQSEKCYNFTKFSKTPIKTVSVSQANKPIYKDSINSFDPYQKYLQKMLKKINKI